MTDFVQLWVYLASTPLFGLTATLVIYVTAAAFYDRTGRAPWANPVLWSVICLGCLLVFTRTPYLTYFAGAQFVHVLLEPAVLALALPLWQRRMELRSRGVALGAARALQVHPDAGAFAGIALGLQVLLASLLIPLLFRWFG